MACHEQEPILAEVELALGMRVERINPARDRSYIGKYRLSVTPTLIVEGDDGTEVARFEGLVHREQLEEVVRGAMPGSQRHA